MKHIIYLIAIVVVMFFGSSTNIMAQEGEHAGTVFRNINVFSADYE